MYQTDWITEANKAERQVAKATYKAKWWITHKQRLNTQRRETRAASPEQRAKEQQYRNLRKAARLTPVSKVKEPSNHANEQTKAPSKRPSR